MTQPASPLAGLRILVTASGGERIGDALRRRGAHPLLVPTIEIRALGGGPLDAALAGARQRDWIVVTSPNGARAVLARFRALGIPPPQEPRWAAVGPATRAALEAEGVTVAFSPAEGNAAAIPAGMGDLTGKGVLLLRSRIAGGDLPRHLDAAGARVLDVAAYDTIEGPDSSREPLARALAGGIDAAVFMSGSTVRGLARLIADARAALGGAILVAIGPATARAIEAAGLASPRVAEARTPEAIVRAIEEGARVHR